MYETRITEMAFRKIDRDKDDKDDKTVKTAKMCAPSQSCKIAERASARQRVATIRKRTRVHSHFEDSRVCTARLYMPTLPETDKLRM